MPGRLAMHAGHDAHTNRRHNVYARSDLRLRADLYAGMAMLAGRASVSGTTAPATASIGAVISAS